MGENTLKLAVYRSHDEVFTDGKFHLWKKGQITNPKWLDRQTGHDFINIKTAGDLADLTKYLAADDERLAAEYYNTFSTGLDKAKNLMICLYDQGETGDQTKRAIIIVHDQTLAMGVLAGVEEYCGVE